MVMKIRWWMISAAVIGVLMLMLGIGNLVDDDNGPLYGQLMLLAVMAAGAALITTGLVLMRRDEARGSKLLALGVLPGSVGIAFFWFPPAFAAGILAIVTSVVAFQSARNTDPEAAHA